MNSRGLTGSSFSLRHWFASRLAMLASRISSRSFHSGSMRV
jgi:hypothetical protein